MMGKIAFRLIKPLIQPPSVEIPWDPLVKDYQEKTRELIDLPHERIDGPRLAWARLGAFKRCG